jgi:hypothetical protein
MYKTLIILDWDDTLFPTSWISENQINITEKDIQNKYIVYFSQLDNLLYGLLTTMLKSADIVIITNAVSKWIEISSNIMPNTQKIINNYIKIVSARDLMEESYPNQPHIWKKHVFKQVTDNHFKQHKYQNIISVGDAEHEFNALTNLYDNMSVIKLKLLKTIRFVRNPSFDSLIDQLQLLSNSVHKIINNKNHMDLTFQPK